MPINSILTNIYVIHPLIAAPFPIYLQAQILGRLGSLEYLAEFPPIMTTIYPQSFHSSYHISPPFPLNQRAKKNGHKNKLVSHPYHIHRKTPQVEFFQKKKKKKKKKTEKKHPYLPHSHPAPPISVSQSKYIDQEVRDTSCPTYTITIFHNPRRGVQGC